MLHHDGRSIVLGFGFFSLGKGAFGILVLTSSTLRPLPIPQPRSLGFFVLLSECVGPQTYIDKGGPILLCSIVMFMLHV